MDFMVFCMVVALFVHTFYGFLAGVVATIKGKLAAVPVAADLTKLEGVVGGVVGSVLAAVKGLFAKL